MRRSEKKFRLLYCVPLSPLVVIALVLLIGTCLCLEGRETGYKYLKNYSYKDYEHSTQNWGMIQGKEGVLYVANNGGMLEFDSVSWRIYGIPDYATVRSLAIDGSGNIYTGGIGEIGCFERNEKGKLNYFSLTAQFSGDKPAFGSVWRTYALHDGIYFCPSNSIIHYHPESKKLKVLQSDGYFYYSFSVGGSLYVHQKGTGLMKMVNHSLECVSDHDVFSRGKERIVMLLPFEQNKSGGKLLVGTKYKGLFCLDGKELNPVSTAVDDYLKENILLHGIRLQSGDLALATRLGGVVVLDAGGGLKYIYHKGSGLQDDYINYLFEDNQENLWLCLGSGISKIENSSPYYIYDHRSRLEGQILTVQRSKGVLYAGTTKGLFGIEPGRTSFRSSYNIAESCWKLCSHKNSFLAATDSGLYQLLDGEKKVLVTQGRCFYVMISKLSSGSGWCGMAQGILPLSIKNGKWDAGDPVPGIQGEVKSIAEDLQGNIWTVSAKSQVVKIDLSRGTDKPRLESFSFAPGLVKRDVVVFQVAGHIVFATPKGIFRLDEGKGEFVPDSTFGNSFKGGPQGKEVFRLVQDSDRNVWITAGSYHYQAVPSRAGSYIIHSTEYLHLPQVQVNDIYPEPGQGNVWFGSIDGLFRFDMNYKKSLLLDMPVLIRGVQVSDKIPLSEAGMIDISIREPLTELPYDMRNIRFFYAAPFFTKETATTYRYFLEGSHDHWTDWSSDTRAEFSDLDSGAYTFRVQAKSSLGDLSDEAVFRFKVLPPWYLAWWAILIYIIAFIASIYAILRWQSHKLISEKNKLENIVRERTFEIKEKNNQLVQQTVRLKHQSEKLKEMDKAKSRFFANISHEFRTPLTLIISPVEQLVKDDFNREQKGIFKSILRNSQYLLNLINQLLDLSRFDSGKMAFQASKQDLVAFLHGVYSNFNTLAAQRKIKLIYKPKLEKLQIFMDVRKMEEAIFNLIANALKFTPTGGKVTISVFRKRNDSESRDDAGISIQDTGVGIAKDQQNHIFDRFFQAKNNKEQAQKGTGIGLALTKEIIQLHGGKIDVFSEEGKGTEFVIYLPLGEESPGGAVTESNPLKPDHQSTANRLVAFLPLEDEDELAEPLSVEEETKEGEKPVVLIVEDHADMRKHIKSILSPFYSIMLAKNGREGIAKAKEQVPDLVVSDIMMPGTDGFQLCRALKKDIATSHLPIILLTARASEESMLDGYEKGADDYITKPFSARMLLTRVKNLIEIRRQMQLKIQRQKMLLPTEIPFSSLDDQFLKDFHALIEKKLDDPDFTLDVLCDKLNLGRSTLFKKIKALTGETPNQFLLTYRLERGAQLLKDRARNVTEVAMEVGFSSSAYFAKCFKDRFDQSPSAYQSTHSGS